MAINHKKVETELPLWMDSSRKEELEKWERALPLKMWPDKDEIESSNQRRGKSDTDFFSYASSPAQGLTSQPDREVFSTLSKEV